MRKKHKYNRKHKKNSNKSVLNPAIISEPMETKTKSSEIKPDLLLQPKITNLLFSFLDGKSATTFLSTSKQILSSSSDNLSSIVESLLPYYVEGSDKKKQAVRDYFTIQSIKEIKNPQSNFGKIYAITSTLTALKLLSNPEHKPVMTDKKDDEWDAILASKEISTDEIKKQKSHVVNKLYRNGITKLIASPEQLNRFVLKDMAIVTSFNFSILESKTCEFLNCFQVIKEVKDFTSKQQASGVDYYTARLTAEIINYVNLSTKKLHAFVVKPQAHPIYAVLQPLPAEPVVNYGENFAILDPELLNKCTANYGASLDLLSSNHPAYHQSIKLNKSAYPLIAQLSDQALTSLAYSTSLGKKSDDFHGQYNKTSSQYIEIQLPNINLQQVKFLYFSPNQKIPNLKNIYDLKEDIPIVIGNNPFLNKQFTREFQAGKINEFLIQKTKKYLYQSALRIGEPDESHLRCSLDEKALKFEFKITRNSPQFHQAQAARILNLLGVRQFFQKYSAISLTYSHLNYHLPLTGKASQEGEITDHDAYHYHHRSLGQLLNVFLKQIISVLLVCCQNETYWKTYYKHHPITHKGATEESNQIIPLSLVEPILNEKFKIDVHWSFDNLMIEVNANKASLPSCVDWVVKCFKGIGLDNKLIIRQNHIFLELPLDKILSQFKKSWFAYKAVAIYDDKDKTGKLLLALRHDGDTTIGYQFPGGHNNDPLGKHDIAYDLEFGSIRNDPVAFEQHLKQFSIIKSPSTSCYLFPLSGFEKLEEEKDEFLTGSLQQFSLHELGNLDEMQIETIAKHFKLDVDQYKKIFGHALPLTPYDSINRYLRFCEKELEKILFTSLQDTTFKDNPVNVHINQNYKTIKYQDKTYWLPESKFGDIEIIAGPETNLHLLADTICTKLPTDLKKNLRIEYNINSSINKMTLSGLNPHAILLLDRKSTWVYKPTRYIPPSLAILTELAKEKSIELAEQLTTEKFIELLDSLKKEDPTGQFNIFNSFGADQERFNKLYFEKLRGIITNPSLYELPKEDIFLLSAAFHSRDYKWMQYISTLYKPLTDINKENETEIVSQIRKLAETFTDKSTILQLAIGNHLISSLLGYSFYLKRLIFKYYPAINMKNTHGHTLLHTISMMHINERLYIDYLVGVLRELMRTDADFNAKDNKGNTPLHYAVENKNFDMVKCLVEECKVDCNAINLKSELALDLAPNNEFFNYLLSKTFLSPDKQQQANQKEIDRLNRLLKELSTKFKFNPSLTFETLDVTDPKCKKLLFAAVKANDEEAIELIIEQLKGDLSVRDKNGDTLLHAACNQLQPADFYRSSLFPLLQHQPNIHAVNNKGISPFYAAAAKQNRLALECLISHAISSKKIEKLSDSEMLEKLKTEAKHGLDGMPLLHVFLLTYLTKEIEQFHFDEAQFMFETYKAGINLTDNHGRNCLHIILNCFNQMSQISKNKASINRFFKSKENDYKYAEIIYNILKLAIDLGADVNAKTKDGCTPLSLAAQTNDPNIKQLLTKDIALSCYSPTKVIAPTV